MGNAYFKHKSLHKYTTVARGQDGVEVMSMIDLVLVKKHVLCAACEDSERNGMRPLRLRFQEGRDWKLPLVCT